MPCPYTDLHIYRLEGRMEPRAAAAGKTFLGHWQEEDSAFLFFSAPEEEAVLTILSNQPQLRLVDRICMPYHQWQGTPLEAESVGRFHIIPFWDSRAGEGSAPAGSIPLVLDPGMVFGTGSHPTTRDCLAALELAMNMGVPDTVLDLGTGTGILALAAAKLGSRIIVAVDNNLLAARTAGRNVELNRLSERILVVQGQAEDFIQYPADLIIANIHGEVMLRLLDTQGLRQKRRLILSGLMRSEAKEVRHRLLRQGLRIYREWLQVGIWHTFYAVKS
jgi:ribosomal protein L11 methyltransferase